VLFWETVSYTYVSFIDLIKQSFWVLDKQAWSSFGESSPSSKLCQLHHHHETSPW